MSRADKLRGFYQRGSSFMSLFFCSLNKAILGLRFLCFCYKSKIRSRGGSLPFSPPLSSCLPAPIILPLHS